MSIVDIIYELTILSTSIKCKDPTYMTRMNGINSLKMSKAAIRNGCNRKNVRSINLCQGKQLNLQYVLTLKTVMNL